MKIQTSTTSSLLNPLHQSFNIQTIVANIHLQFLRYSCNTNTIAISTMYVSTLILIQLVLIEAKFS